MKKLFLLLISLMLVLSVGCSKTEETKGENKSARIGFFPNVTHPQALLGRGSDIFTKEISTDFAIDWRQFNAGPAELEALLTGEIDIGYIGPGPAVNGCIVSKGDLKIIAGASEAGAVLVKGKNSDIKNVDDLKGKKVSIPQYGNTQDIVLRGLLKDNDLKDTVRFLVESLYLNKNINATQGKIVSYTEKHDDYSESTTYSSDGDFETLLWYGIPIIKEYLDVLNNYRGESVVSPS